MGRRHPSAQWERFGQLDPYYGVISSEEYRRENLTDEALDRFYASGAEHVDWLMGLLGDVRPQRALDFGCGVGRIVVAMAQRWDEVTGVDVSPSVLAECRRACDARGLTNVRLSERIPDEQFDLVHSAIVLQHIPVAEGYGLIDELARRVAPGGVGALHVTLRAGTRRARVFLWCMKHVPFAPNVWNLARRRAWSYPHMQMNTYRLDVILERLAACGIPEMRAIYMPSAGPVGFHSAMLVFDGAT